ncbi:MAG: MoxR family ATPase [Verrucomicrobia bacterium]|jgi:MoxR-like ATPase|nr:MoxR family ATPase [Verrucomicrobiota bacterium]MBT7067933.1 MoxR family ATPase [Verrucomicrobiota bacterium]MBT7702388.1 MoxR family ATPase [Verrucomicrobiota bacterium]
MSVDIEQTTDLIKQQTDAVEALRQEVNKVIVGQEKLIDRMLIALVTGGHILLEGVPGLAKTTAVQTLSQALGLDFHRISFTPDLLPADVVGTMIYNPKEGSFSSKQGPVFTNLLLADEINRAPAKVQSALLEAMQEHRVTLGNSTYNLPDPFLVMATQNPIEQEGTYPLPEAQIDRFMLKCVITHPSRDDERRIMNRFTRNQSFDVKAVMSAEQIFTLRKTLDQVYCDEKVGDYILDIVFATRDPALFNLDIAHQIEYGASPRATLYLNLAARANAMLNGRAYATPQDVKEIAHDVLRHRIILTYEAEAEEVSSDDIVSTLLSEIPVP